MKTKNEKGMVNMKIATLMALLFSALVFVLTTAGCHKGGNKLDSQITAKLDSTRQAGYPVTPAEHNDWYAEPPAAENATSLYLQAFEALVPNDSKTMSPTFLTKNQKTLELLHQAASLKKCRYPADLGQGVNVTLPHLPKLKECALLLLQSTESHATKGQMDLVAQSILDGLRLARSLEDEPILISSMMLIAAEAMAQKSVEAALNRKSLSDEQLVRLQAAFNEAEKGIPLTRVLAGERCNGIAAFQGPPEDLAKAMNLLSGNSGTIDLIAHRKSPAFQQDYLFYLDQMEQAVSMSTLPYPKSLEGLSEWDSKLNEAKTKGYSISGIFLPAIKLSMERMGDAVARMRMASAALAIERYRVAHANALPDSLSQLTPQFLDAVPADPFDGQPLRYAKLSPRGFTVSSIGRNRTGDGKPKSLNPLDVAFELKFVMRR